MFTTVALLLLLTTYAICSLRIIREDEMAVVIILGKPRYVVGSGLRIVPFLIGNMTIYPTIPTRIRCDLISVLTKGSADTGSVPVSLKNISIRVKFASETLMETVQTFPKPPKRKALGGWEDLNADWVALLAKMLRSSAQGATYKHVWNDLFQSSAKIAGQIQNEIAPEFPCFSEMKVFIGDVNMGTVTNAVARQEVARQNAQGTIVEAATYATTAVVRAEAEKAAAILQGQGDAEATKDLVDALGGDPRILVALKLAESKSTVVLSSGFIDPADAGKKVINQ